MTVLSHCYVNPPGPPISSHHGEVTISKQENDWLSDLTIIKRYQKIVLVLMR